MVTEQLKDAFWEAVSDCLVRFHGFLRTEAGALVSARRSDIERAPNGGFEPGLIYHDEPFYIASRIAGHEVNLEPHLAAYHAILTQRLGPVAEVAVPAASASHPGLAGGEW